MPNWTLHNSIRTIGQLNIVNENNKLDIWARAQELTRLEWSRIGASPLTLSALLWATCHLGGWLSLILETGRGQSHAVGADQARGLKLSITTRPNAVAHRRGWPGQHLGQIEQMVHWTFPCTLAFCKNKPNDHSIYTQSFIIIENEDEYDVRLLKQQSSSEEGSENELDNGNNSGSSGATDLGDSYDSDDNDGMTMKV